MQGFRELIRLHLAHQAERSAARRQDEMRGEIARMDERLAGDRERLAAAQAQLEETTKGRHAIEGEVELLEHSRERYRGQLMEAKTNEVYKTLLHEIETAGARISEKETSILELMETAEQAAAEVAVVQAALAESERVAAADTKRLLEEIEQQEKERVAAHAEAVSWEAKVPASLLGRYERIAAAREGRGLTRAVDVQCTECHVGIRPQVWVELVTRPEIFSCPGCGRILYRTECLDEGIGPSDVGQGGGTAS